jgi:F0F1-type ATP synthase delta subunit
MKLADQYAHILETLPQDHSGADRFISFLKRRGHLKLLPAILSAYARLEAKSAKVATDVIVVARDADQESAKIAAAKYGAHNAKLVVDHSVIGGWRFTGKSLLVDRTYKRALLDLYRTMTS